MIQKHADLLKSQGKYEEAEDFVMSFYERDDEPPTPKVTFKGLKTIEDVIKMQGLHYFASQEYDMKRNFEDCLFILKQFAGGEAVQCFYQNHIGLVESCAIEYEEYTLTDGEIWITNIKPTLNNSTSTTLKELCENGNFLIKTQCKIPLYKNQNTPSNNTRGAIDIYRLLTLLYKEEDITIKLTGININPFSKLVTIKAPNFEILVEEEIFDPTNFCFNPF